LRDALRTTHPWTIATSLAIEARTRNHRQTELWPYLPKERRPPEAFAQRTISTVMRETYLLFARWTAMISIAEWTIALFFSVIGL
jgi:hypothetical protein